MRLTTHAATGALQTPPSLPPFGVVHLGRTMGWKFAQETLLGFHSKNGHTTSIIGVTMNDTKPIFFKKLNEAGFVYERIADHLLDTKFRGGTAFGIFIIQLN